MLEDPITHTRLVQPVLASDGITYSARALQSAMASDPWRRSPVTREVLRRDAYVNLFAYEMLLEPVPAVVDTVQLWQDSDGDDATSLPSDGRQITWGLASRLNATDTLTRRKWSLPDNATVSGVIQRDAAGLDWLMHPPAAAEMRADILDLARLFGVSFAVRNPWCLTTATVMPGNQTVEQMWAGIAKAPFSSATS